MSEEKRFKLDFNNCSEGTIMDTHNKYGQYCKLYDFGQIGRQQIVDLLNEQQATIQLLKDFIKKEFPKSYKHILEGLDE